LTYDTPGCRSSRRNCNGEITGKGVEEVEGEAEDKKEEK
jgi:hypothetical protein